MSSQGNEVEGDDTNTSGSIHVDLSEEDPEYEKKMAALELLDVLTSTDDEDDPAYDVNKDIRRDNLLMNNDYHDLKLQLRKKGLKTGGDKGEMIARLLLHVIDPTINYMEATGREPNLSYIDENDIASGAVNLVPVNERNKVVYDFDRASAEEDKEDENASMFTRRPANDVLGIDADDVRVLRPRAGARHAGTGGDDADRRRSSPPSAQRDQLMMDGLARQEIAFKPLCISRSSEQTRREDSWADESPPRNGEGGSNTQTETTPYVRAYIVGGRDVLRTWERNPTVIVLLPDVLSQSREKQASEKGVSGEDRALREARERNGRGWRSRGLRVMADELAFNMQCIVIVPDLARGMENVLVGEDYCKSKASSHATGAVEAEEAISEEMMGGTTSAAPGEGVSAADDAVKRRMLDDIITTLHYARTTYESESVSVAGVGSGAGLALEASCDVYNMACLSQIYQLDDYTDNDRSSEVGDSGSTSLEKDWDMCGGLWTEQGRMAPQPPASVNYYKALSAHRHSLSDSRGSHSGTSRDFPYLQDYFETEDGSLEAAPPGNAYDMEWDALDWSDLDACEEEDGDGHSTASAGASEPLTEDALELMAESVLARLMEEHEDCVPQDDEDEDEDEPEVLENIAASTYFGDSRGGVQPTADGSVEEEEEEEGDGGVYEGDLERALQKADAAAKKKVEEKQSMAARRRERAQQLVSMKQEEKREIMAITRRADEKAATRALTRGTLSPVSALSLTDMPALLPRSLFLVNPCLYDAERVAQELRLPSYFVFSCDHEWASLPNQATSQPATGTTGRAVSSATDLMFTLKKRRHEIVDFCIRQYEGVSADFLCCPESAGDAVCGQEAMVIGSAWLDIYSRRLMSKYRADISRHTSTEEGIGQVEHIGSDAREGEEAADRDRSAGNMGLTDFGYTEDSQVLAQTKFDGPFVRVDADQLGGTAATEALLRQREEESREHGLGGKDEFRRPSPVATFLHEDSQLYREDPKEGFEYQSAV